MRSLIRCLFPWLTSGLLVKLISKHTSVHLEAPPTVLPKDEFGPLCIDWTLEIADWREYSTSGSIVKLGEPQYFFADLPKLSFDHLNGCRPITLVQPPLDINLHLRCSSLLDREILAQLAWLIPVVNVADQFETACFTCAVFLVTLILES